MIRDPHPLLMIVDPGPTVRMVQDHTHIPNLQDPAVAIEMKVDVVATILHKFMWLVYINVPARTTWEITSLSSVASRTLCWSTTTLLLTLMIMRQQREQSRKCTGELSSTAKTLQSNNQVEKNKKTYIYFDWLWYDENEIIRTIYIRVH